MTGRGPRQLFRRVRATPTAALVLLLAVVLLAAAAGVVVLAARRPATTATGTGRPSRSASPSRSALPGPVLSPQPETAALPTAAGLAGALGGPLRQPQLGGSVGWAVADATSGRVLAGARPDALFIPASATKLTTALAVLGGPGGARRLTTRVVAGRAPGQVVLVGAGDPTLSVDARQAYPGGGRLDVLAGQVRTALAGQRVTSVVVDGSAYSGSTYGPGWDSGLIAAGDVAPITALMVDGGRVDPLHRARTSSPAVFAGKAFARLLGAPGAPVVQGVAPASGRVLGSVHSAPLSRIVEECLLVSDNVAAEMLARQVAIWAHQPASFAGAARAVRARLAALGLPVADDRLVDGSGLSRTDRLSPALLVGALSAAAAGDHPQLRAVLTDLPVAGFSGTLGDRFRMAGHRSAAAGRVRAKTGTLSGVSTLSGLVVDASGRLLVFALLSNRVPAGGTTAAEAALDRVATTLAGCGCR